MDYEIQLREIPKNPYAVLIRDSIARGLRNASAYGLEPVTDAERMDIANFAMQEVNDAWAHTALYQRLEKEGKL